MNGARFTPKGGFDSVYLASDPITALSEVVSVFNHANWAGATPPKAYPWTVFTVEGVVADVVDLTDTNTLNALDTNDQEMSGIWATVTNPPTQALGAAAFANKKIAGLRFKSSKKHPDGACVVIFSDRLALSKQNCLEVYDPDGDLHQRLP